MKKKLAQKNTLTSLTPELQQVREFLIDFAHKANYDKKHYICYGNLCKECGLELDMNNKGYGATIGKILDEISYYEIDNERPVLSSLVVTQDYLEPGTGFYTLCAEKFPNLGSKTKQKEDRVDLKMAKDCITFWNDDKNYNDNREYKAPINEE